MLVLTVVTYYLAGNGKINNFPTYLAALAFLPFIIVRPDCFSSFNKPILSLIIIFLLYLCTSVYWSNNTSGIVLAKYAGYFFLLITYVLGIALMSSQFPSFLKWLLVISILSATISSIYSMFLYLALPDYQPLIEKRLYSLGRLHNPVIASLSYGMAATLCANFLLIHIGRIRVLWAICLVILLLAIMLTETRSVWFGLIISLPVALLLQENLGSRRKITVLLSAFGILVVLGSGTWAMGYWDEILHRAYSYRPEIWLTTIQNTLATNLLFGNGIVTSSDLTFDGYYFQHPHSIYIATFFYGGVVGLGLLLLLIATCFWQVLKVRLSPLAILATSSLSYAAVVFFFDGNRLLTKVDFVWIAFWLPVALCLIATLRNGAIDIDWKQESGATEY